MKLNALANQFLCIYVGRVFIIVKQLKAWFNKYMEILLIILGSILLVSAFGTFIKALDIPKGQSFEVVLIIALILFLLGLGVYTGAYFKIRSREREEEKEREDRKKESEEIEKRAQEREKRAQERHELIFGGIQPIVKDKNDILKDKVNMKTQEPKMEK